MTALTTAVQWPADARVWFISDLHLWIDRPRTLARFESTVMQASLEADALFILGDLFEYWAGDDDLAHPAATPVLAALAAAADAGLSIYLMSGNRDVLLGAAFASAAHCTLLGDECELTVGTERLLLMHGDSLCTDDVAYQQFRTQARHPTAQAAFLGQALATRHALIARMRAASEDKKNRTAMAIMDVNATAVAAAMARHQVNTLIHGHTHRPARHTFEIDGAPAVRCVLSDWEYDEPGEAERGGAMTLHYGVLTAA